MQATQSKTPGVILTACIALCALFVQKLPFAPFTIDGRHPIDGMLIAIIVGMLIRNLSALNAIFRPGIQYAVKKILPFAIVLMGAKLNFAYVVEVSSRALMISMICVVMALALTLWLARRVGVTQKLGILIGVGTAICGGTAIAVTAPTIEADDNDTAFAITTITLFGLIAIFVFPIIGHLLGMDAYSFGVWAGIGIQATPQVMAAGFAYSETAGEVAVIVKLVRVLLLAPMIVVLGIWYTRQKRRMQQAHVQQPTRWTVLFPPFILGFIALAVANTLHLLPDFTVHLKESALWSAQSIPLSMKTAVTQSSLFLVTMAMAGVGLGVHVKSLIQVGLKAVYVGLFSALVLSGVGLALLQFML